jgi:hypothetical protein
MVSLNCRWILPDSPLRPYVVDPIQEGIYALFHVSVIEGAWTDPKALKERITYAALGAALLCPIIGTFALQIFIRVSIAYETAFHNAVREGNLEEVNWYLKMGVSPNLHPKYRPLLLQTTNHAILQALIDHGAERDFSYYNQTFSDYLIRNGLEVLAARYFPDSYQTLTTKEVVSKGGYRPYSKSPLETIIATQNEGRLQTFVENRTFDEVYTAYLELKTALPRINTDWIWDVLYEIPETHYQNAKGVQEEEQLTRDPPILSNLEELITLFDRINFANPTGAHYVTKEALMDTLDNAPRHYSPEELKQGFRNIIQALNTGRYIYTLTPEQVMGYRRQVEWILYYLKQKSGEEPLHRDKANVLIEIAKTCLMCPGRYNEVFDAAIKRLKGDPIEVPTFEKQVTERFADLRSRTITAIAFKEAKGCIHARENLVFHLHQEKGIVETSPESIFSSQQGGVEHYKFTVKREAMDAFNREYTPRALIQVFLECVREKKGKTQKENDFNALLFDAMIESYAKKFPEIQALEKRMQELEHRRLSKTEVEALFKPIDPDYACPQQELTTGAYFSRFKKDFLAPKIRPLHEETYGDLLPEVIHPLILGKLLCDMGHLKARNPFLKGRVC